MTVLFALSRWRQEDREYKVGTNRATFEPDCGRRGKLWIHAVFEPATGQAAIILSPGRDSASHVQLLDKIVIEFPADRSLMIEDSCRC